MEWQNKSASKLVRKQKQQFAHNQIAELNYLFSYLYDFIQIIGKNHERMENKKNSTYMFYP